MILCGLQWMFHIASGGIGEGMPGNQHILHRDAKDAFPTRASRLDETWVTREPLGYDRSAKWRPADRLRHPTTDAEDRTAERSRHVPDCGFHRIDRLRFGDQRDETWPG
jgi:hypothetical protein